MKTDFTVLELEKLLPETKIRITSDDVEDAINILSGLYLITAFGAHAFRTKREEFLSARKDDKVSVAEICTFKQVELDEALTMYFNVSRRYRHL